MRTGFYLFLLSWLLVMGCDPEESEPVYPPEPFVENGVLEFVKGSLPDLVMDTMRLTFDFRDGDFDLGLTFEDFLNSPFHFADYFLEQNGALIRVTPKRASINSFYEVIDPPAGQSGKLATYRHLKRVMQNPPPLTCDNYYAIYGSVGVINKALVDETYHFSDTIWESNPNVYTLVDTFLIDFNENHYNIFIDYLVEQPDGSFQYFDWNKDICERLQGNWKFFYGRFPLLEGNWKSPVIKNGPYEIRRVSKQKGVFIFNMISHQFSWNFKGKRVKVAFSIQDRALNRSNVAETPVIEIPE